MLAEFLFLLSVRWRGALNGFKLRSKGKRLRTALMAMLGVLFWAGIFLATRRVLIHVQTEIPDFWMQIHFKLFSMVFLTFLSILLFSNVVTSLSSFFLSDDLDLLLAVPVATSSIYYAKFVETLVLSSWMVAVFGLPVLLAFGIVWKAGIIYYALALAMEIPFLLIPAAIGTMLTMTLVKVFPARRARDLLVILSLIVAGAVFMMFRLMKPEQFVNATARINLWEGVLSFEANDFVPSEWFTRIMMEVLHNRPIPIFNLLLLAFTGLALVVIGEWLAEFIYRDGWSKAQEGKRAPISRSGVFSIFIRAVSSLFPSSIRHIVVKDLKTFFRDATQWGQLFLLAAIMVVYVFNFKALPLASLPINQFKLVNWVSFVNLALASFVVSAVSVRFVYPMVSLEGRSWWVIASSPLNERNYLWSKFMVSILPLLFLSELLLIVTNILLKVSPFMMWLSAGGIFVMTFGITGLGVGMGALYPRFNVENAAQISVSYGGVTYMILSMGFIAVSVVLLATPASAIFNAQVHGQTVGSFLWWALIIAFLLVTVLSIATAIIPMRMGVKALRALEV